MKLELDFIPRTAWNKNLRNALGRTRWDKLRKRILLDQGNVSATCGSAEKLQCHEVWEFDDVRGIQHLKGFQVSLSLCHLGSHLGLARILATQGHVDLEKVIRHFLEVNGMSIEEFHQHLDDTMAISEERSAREWKLDLGEWADLVPKS